MASDSAIECKQLARNIKNYDVTRWNEVAESECFDGILEKFTQKPCPEQSATRHWSQDHS